MSRQLKVKYFNANGRTVQTKTFNILDSATDEQIAQFIQAMNRLLDYYDSFYIYVIQSREIDYYDFIWD